MEFGVIDAATPPYINNVRYSTCVKPHPLWLSHLHIDAVGPAVQSPVVIRDVGVTQRQALDAVELHRLARLNDDITACDGDGRSLVSWRRTLMSQRDDT